MKRILTYALFEGKYEEGRKISKDLKPYRYFKDRLIYELKYFFNRGLVGTFGVHEEEGKKYLAFYFRDVESPIVFHFYLLDDGDIQNNTTEDPSILLRKDYQSLVDFSKEIGVNPITIDEFKKRLETIKYSHLENFSVDKFPEYKILSGRFYDRYNRTPFIYIQNFLIICMELLDSVRSDERSEISQEDITNLPIWKDLSSIGAINSTTPLIWKNKNFKITHQIFGKDSLTIYTTGPIRKTVDGRPAVMPSAPGETIKSIKDWNLKLDYVLKYILKSIAKKIGITSTKTLNEISSSMDGFFDYLWENYPNEFQKWFSELEFEMAEILITNHLNIKKMFDDNLGKATITFRKHYNNPKVKEVVDSLENETTRKNIRIASGISDLGF